MDLSRPLARALERLIRPGWIVSGSLRAAVYEDRSLRAAENKTTVVLTARTPFGETKSVQSIASTGVARGQSGAAIKALAELGESLILYREKLPNRNGLAGGLFARSAKERGRFELLERDAFLHHYRNRLPAKRVRSEILDEQEILLAELWSADPDVTCMIASPRATAEGRADCLLMGLGAHTNARTARGKAVAELQTLILKHRLQPGWCEGIWNNPATAKRLADFHHAQSRDPRNRQTMKAVFGPAVTREPSPLSRRATPEGWRYRNFESPIRGFQYFAAAHPEMLSLDFGVPEPGESTLYHPVW